MIVIVDYGMGNLRSAQKGFEENGHTATISQDPRDLTEADGIVLPGVGAFKDCFEGLCNRGFRQPLLDAVAQGKPLLGICVGMQLLFDRGEEGEGSPGLGILHGEVLRFPEAKGSGFKVPHMGWNRIQPRARRPCPILKGPQTQPYLYFVHSYRPVPTNNDDIYATTTYGVQFASVVGRDNVFGTQFHPEKSQRAGLAILKAFGDFVHNAHGSSRTERSAGQGESKAAR